MEGRKEKEREKSEEKERKRKEEKLRREEKDILQCVGCAQCGKGRWHQTGHPGRRSQTWRGGRHWLASSWYILPGGNAFTVLNEWKHQKKNKISWQIEMLWNSHKRSFIGTWPCWFIYTPSLAATTLHKPGPTAVTEAMWPTKPKIFILWLFIEHVCWPFNKSDKWKSRKKEEKPLALKEWLRLLEWNWEMTVPKEWPRHRQVSGGWQKGI